MSNNKEIREIVVNALTERKSMPFLEVTSLYNINDNDLKPVINDLACEGLVKIINSEDDLEMIVTATTTLLQK